MSRVVSAGFKRGRLHWAVLALLTVSFPGVAAGYSEAEVREGGSIFGRVTFSGVVPETGSIPVVKNPEFCGVRAWDPALVVNSANQGIKNTVVYLEKVERGKSFPKTVFVDAFKCLFVPHATAVITNRPVLFHTSDTVFHNVHAFNEKGKTLFNLPLPTLGKSVTRTIKKGGIVQLQCDSHVHMNAWIVALDHPYFSVTDENGRYRISDVPEGEYTLVAWHEGYVMTNRSSIDSFSGSDLEPLDRPVYEGSEKLSKSVTVTPNGESVVNFELHAR